MATQNEEPPEPPRDLGANPQAEPLSEPEALCFGQAFATSANLVFGESGLRSWARGVTALRFAATLPLPTAQLRFIPPARASLRGTLPDLRVQTWGLRAALPLVVDARGQLPGLAAAGELRYISRAQRPTVGAVVNRAQPTRAMGSGASQGQQVAQAHSGGGAWPWQRAQGRLSGVEHRLPAVLAPQALALCTHQQQATGSRVSSEFAEQSASHHELERLAPFAGARGSRAPTRFAHQDGGRHARASRRSAWQSARGEAQRQASSHQGAVALPRGWGAGFEAASPPRAGLSRLPVPPTPKPPGPPRPGDPYRPSPDLRFEGLWGASSRLYFVNPNSAGSSSDGGPKLVPIRRVYLVLNEVTLQRLQDDGSPGEAVPAFGLSLSLDANSWAWGFEAQLPLSAQSLVLPRSNAPVELLARVNGMTFALLAENLSRDRVFGDARLRLSGRGRNALLAAPYAPVLNFQQTAPRSARQLMDDVLTLNGVPLGWRIDWGLTDWDLPAGVFLRQGTWMEALLSIANAAGGYLIPHSSEPRIAVQHRYPVAPWQWASLSPDVVLPVDAVARESLRWVDKPAYNRVFVSGQEVGVLGDITRAGTAGDMLAPMVVNPLITQAAAARQRGLAVLADTGRQIEVSLRLPVWPQTGVIQPGTLIEYQDASEGPLVRRLGLVRSTQIEASMPEVWQTLGVQSHG